MFRLQLVVEVTQICTAETDMSYSEYNKNYTIKLILKLTNMDS